MDSEERPVEVPFLGFQRPNYTPVPDELFDKLLPSLGGAELKAVLYIIRRTFGFKKDRDAISFSQFIRGIRLRSGEVLDRGCGIRDRGTLVRALRSLEEKNVVRSWKGIDERGENETTVYALRFAGQPEVPQRSGGGVVGYSHHRSGEMPPGVVAETHYGSGVSPSGVVGDTYPQEIDGQETVRQGRQQQRAEEQAVVVLSQCGVTKNIARELVDRYPLERIHAQVDMLEYRAAKDPAAMLVRAIQEDWAPPPGYETLEERTARALQWERSKADAEALAREREQLRSTWRERAIQQYRIDESTLKLWERAQELLVRWVGPSAHDRLFKEALLALVGNGTAQILLPYAWQKGQVRPEYREAVEQVLRAELKRSISVEFRHCR